MESDSLRSQALDLLDTADVGVVTTLDVDGRPQSRAMFNLRNRAQFAGLAPFFTASAGGFETWFTTNTSSPKMRDLAGDGRASAYYCRPGDWRGLMLGGTMEVVEDPVAKAALWQEGWELYYPGGPQDPDFSVLRLRPTQVKYYHQLRFVEWAA